MRQTIVIALVVLGLILIGTLYGLLFLMSTGADSVTLGNAESGARVQFANLALLIMLTLPALFALAWLFDVPRRLARMRGRADASKALAAMQTALIALASGDHKGARRAALAADRKLDGAIGARVIAAQASEQLGDLVGAESQYAAMLAHRETEMVGRRGLAAAALTRGDYETAIINAAQGFDADPNARWAFELLFDAQLRSGRWHAALETLRTGRKRDHVGEGAMRRRKAVLLAAQAQAEELQDLAAATGHAIEATRTAPDFAPAAALAARLLTLSGKPWKALNLIETAWAEAPHPALALAYRDLKPDDTPLALARRLKGLAELKPQHRESTIVQAEAALMIKDSAAARLVLSGLAGSPDASQRICTLMARIEEMDGAADKARDWAARALSAPDEADWSDLDPEGPAFAYTRDDWARLVYSFGDRGLLIHPRHERFQRGRMIDPSLPKLLAGPTGQQPGKDVAAAATKSGEASASTALVPATPRRRNRDLADTIASAGGAVLPPSPDDPGIGSEIESQTKGKR
jgi:HemY protein